MEIVQPVRVKRTYIQKLYAQPGKIFPLLCPVRETEWVEGWNPLMIYTNSGFAEQDCVFTTGEEEPDSVWVITRFEPDKHELEIVKVSPGMTVGKITITLSENGAQAGRTEATVTYMYTAISKSGEEFVQNYSEEYFDRFMAFWELRLNQYLEANRGGAGGN